MTRRTVLLIAVIAVALAVAVAIAVVVVVRDDSASINALAAWSTFATAVATFILVMGAFLAAIGIVHQIDEARQSREAALRPILIVTDAYPADENGLDPPRLLIRNIGPGPALNVRVEVWWTEDLPHSDAGHLERERLIEEEGREYARSRRPPDIGYPWPFSLASGAAASVPVWKWGPEHAIVPGDRIRFRLGFDDVFGRHFLEPPDGTLGHQWAKDSLLSQVEGDYELRLI